MGILALGVLSLDCTPTRKKTEAAVPFQSLHKELPENLAPHGDAFRSQGLALNADESFVVSANELNSSIDLISTTDLTTLRRYPIPVVPHHVAILRQTIVVTSLSSGDVYIGSGTTFRPVATGCRATEHVVTVGPAAWVSCPLERVLIRIGEDDKVQAKLGVPSRPFDLGRVGDALFVATSTGAYSLASTANSEWTARVDLGDSPPPAETSFAPPFVLALSPGTTPTLLAQQVRNARSFTKPPLPSGYGAETGGEAFFRTTIRGRCRGTLEPDDDGPVLVGASAAVEDPATGDLVSSFQYVGRISAFRCGGMGDAPRAIASWGVGHGARDLVLVPSKRAVFTHARFDASYVRVGLDDDKILRAKSPLVPGTLTEGLPIFRGRVAFHDAANPNLTPSRSFACASCHHDGGDDGLSWNIDTAKIPSKRRKTPPLWSLPLNGALHSDGEYRDLVRLVEDTVVGLHGGTGLGVRFGDLAAYVASLTAPGAKSGMGPPAGSAPERGGADACGEREFQRPRATATGATSCATCHTGTTGGDGALHDVGQGNGERPERRLRRVRTASLSALAFRTRFLHDGSAADLPTALSNHARGLGGEFADLEKPLVECIASWLLLEK